MKKLVPLFSAMLFFSAAFGQLEFLPEGSSWVSFTDCFGNVNYDFNSVTTTEDTVIQGKPCKKMAYLDWICDAWPPPNFTYIHQDGGKVYRYDLADQEF